MGNCDSSASALPAGTGIATDGHDMPWTMICVAMTSVADTAVRPMQDVLAMPTESLMNFAGQTSGWWGWRFQWNQVQPWHAGRLLELGRLYGRLTAGPLSR